MNSDNNKLLYFRNGVYDSITDTFKEGFPDDYIYKFTHYDYIKFNDDDPKIKEVKTFINIFDKNIKFIIDICAHSLFENKHNIYFLNCKHTKNILIIFKLISCALGDYFHSKSLSTINFNCSINKKIMFIDESENNLLYLSKNKNLTINQIVEYYNNRLLDVDCNAIFVLNAEPEFLNIKDEPNLNRFKFISFNSKDINKIYMPTDDEINIQDKLNLGYNFINDIKFVQAFMYILIQRYKQIKNEDIIIPNDIINYKIYVKINTYDSFIKEYCEINEEYKENYECFIETFYKFLIDNNLNKQSFNNLYEFLFKEGYYIKYNRNENIKYIYGLKLIKK